MRPRHVARWHKARDLRHDRRGDLTPRASWKGVRWPERPKLCRRAIDMDGGQSSRRALDFPTASRVIRRAFPSRGRLLVTMLCQQSQRAPALQLGCEEWGSAVFNLSADSLDEADQRCEAEGEIPDRMVGIRGAVRRQGPSGAVARLHASCAGASNRVSTTSCASKSSRVATLYNNLLQNLCEEPCLFSAGQNFRTLGGWSHIKPSAPACRLGQRLRHVTRR